MPSNELYLAVLPLVHISPYVSFGLTEQTLTLFPGKEFATEFFANEVDEYIRLFQWRAEKYLVGGHVTRYEFQKEESNSGRFRVRVIQHVE